MFKKILRYIGYLLHFFYPAKLSEYMQATVAHIYTGYLSAYFGHIGHNSVFAFRMSLHRGASRISIGNNVQIEKGAEMYTWSSNARIIIGNDCQLRTYFKISAYDSILIGNGLLTGTNVLITDNSHGATEIAQLRINPNCRPVYSKGPVEIGNNVWIGNNVCIMPNVKIGDGVIIGANSVVTHDIPPYSVAAGCPAHVIKTLQ